MKLLIIGNGRGYHVTSLVKAARELGHQPIVVEFKRIGNQVSSDGRTTSLGGLPVKAFDVVLVRSIPGGSLEQVTLRLNSLHEYVAEGTPVVNSPACVERCVDKYATMTHLSRHRVPTPRTFVCDDAESALNSFHGLGRDVVVKPIFGSEGRGIVRLTDETSARRVFEGLEQIGAVAYVQEFIPHPGFDVRLLVVGSRLIAAMKRFAPEDEFRTNAALGGRCEALVPDDQLTDLALRATEAVGAEIAGVDVIQRANGERCVIEINSAPGFRHLAKTTSIDIGKTMVEHVERLVADRMNEK